jgi:hypothetical protein
VSADALSRALGGRLVSSPTNFRAVVRGAAIVSALAVLAGSAAPAVAQTTSPHLSAAAAPGVVNVSDSVLVTLEAAPGYPALSQAIVAADLSGLGGSIHTPMNDTGVDGDVVAGDHVYSVRAVVAPGTLAGVKPISIIVMGAVGGAAYLSVTVVAPPQPPSGTATIVPLTSAVPATVTHTRPIRIEATVQPGQGPISTGLGVTLDLRAFGLFETTPLADEGGAACDRVAGDLVFSVCLLVPSTVNVGTVTATGVVFDAQGRGSPIELSAQVVAPADADADGLSDSCEQAFGLQSTSGAGDDGPTGDPDGDGRTNEQECVAQTHPRGRFTRYLAEGAANSFFRTRIALFNPSATPAIALVSFLPDASARQRIVVEVPAHAVRNLMPGDTRALILGSFATLVESDVELVVDRAMTWGQDDEGSHLETAVHAPSTTWLLAEGATGWRFSLFYLLQNPSPSSDANVRISYLRGAGDPVLTREYFLVAGRRMTIPVDDEQFPLGSGQYPLAATDVSARIEVTNGVPIVVERAMYMSPDGHPFGAGHAAAAVAAPSTTWYFAEGATGGFFDEFLLLANTGATPATVDVTFVPEGAAAAPQLVHYVVPANSRTTIWVDQLPGLDNQSLSAQVTSDVPIVAERAMWWPGSGESWREGHVSAGAAARSPRWAIAGLEVGGPHDAQSYILVSGGGSISIYDEFGLSSPCGTSAGGRFTVRVNECAAQRGQFVGAIVEGNANTVVEWVTYRSANGEPFAAGGGALAAPIP